MPSKSNTQKNITDALTSAKKKEKRDYFLLALPWKSASLKIKIANKIIALLARQPLLREREIIEKLINEDEEVKQYIQQTQSISTIRYVIWTLAKRKVIYKAKILGDDKHIYYFLPEQLNIVKSHVLLYPSDFNPSVLKNYSKDTGTSASTSTGASVSTGTRTNTGTVSEEEEEEEDEWIEECLKSDDEC